MEGFQEVFFLEVGKAFDTDTALEACGDLAHVVLESSEAVERAGVDGSAAADDADLAPAGEDAIGDLAPGDAAAPAHGEDGLHEGVAVNDLVLFGLEQALEGLLDLIGKAVDDVVEANLDTFLLGKEVPPVGADTLFANMYAAYDALPQSTKAEIDGLSVVVSRVHAYQAYYPDREPMTDAEKAALPEVIQPLVRVHPETGLKALYCGGGEVAWNIQGWELLKGQGLLRELRHFATMPRFVYAHEWRMGDLVFWDNRCSLHSATLFDTEKHRRLAWRTTVSGEAAIPVTREAAE